MKKLLLLVLVLVAQSSFAQDGFRFIDREYFTASASIDPTSSIKEHGLDIVGELEYVGIIYAKIGVESFSKLTGGYQDIHYGIGLNFTSGYFDTLRYYVGIRQAKVDRDGGWKLNNGLEAGIDYNVNDDLFIGLRSTLDKRHDQEIFGWTPELKFSGFVRLGYKWNCKPRYKYRRV
jgi:hypothetical protein